MNRYAKLAPQVLIALRLAPQVLIALFLVPLVSMALFTPTTQAAGVYLGGYSQHFATDGEFNETHNLVALEYKGWIGGGFINSFDDPTGFAGYNFNWSFGWLETGVITGLSYGYDDNDEKLGFLSSLNYKGWMPLAIPYVTISDLPVRPVVGLLGNAVFITLNLNW